MGGAVIEHAKRGHAIFGMSSLYRWIHCATYAWWAKELPRKPDTPASLRGTRLHEWLNYLILTELLGQEVNPPAELMTKDEKAAITEIVAYVANIVAAFPDMQLVTEQYMPFPQNVVPHSYVGGTGDIILYSQRSLRAWVIDAKFGRIFVLERQNAQGLGYAVSALWHVPVAWVTIVIAQPFAPDADGTTIREWTCTADYLVEFQVEVERALIRATSPNPQPTAGKWCAYCPAELVCPARKARIEAATGRDFAHVKPLDNMPAPDPKPVMRAASDEQLAHLLSLEADVAAFMSAAHREATDRARAGRKIPGFKLVDAQAKAAWKDFAKKDSTAARELAKQLALIIGDAVFANDGDAWQEAELAGDFERWIDQFVVVTTPNLGDSREKLVDLITERLEARNTPARVMREIILHAKNRLTMLTEKKQTGNTTLVPIGSNREEFEPNKRTLKNFAHVKPLE